MFGSEVIIDHVIVPPVEAREMVKRAGKVYLRDCPCRVREQVCPPDTWEVCLLFEGAAEEDLRDARLIRQEEALALLEDSANRGLINQVFYTRAERRVTEICNCCTCCCLPLREMKEQGAYGECRRSDYVAVTDVDLCVGCGMCEEPCFFEARWVEGGVVNLVDERCFGCGRCLASCPEGAIGLEKRAGRGMEIPTKVV
jgi:ferredoxin